MIAREREFADLCSRLSSVATGTGTTALICGEPGIGKTTLADALAIEAVSRGVNVAWGRCWEVLGGPAYWPWIQVLRSLFDEVDRSDSRPQLESEAAFIRRCIPELIPPSGVPFAAEPGVPTSTTQNDPEVLRFELFESVLRLLTIASRNAARLLIFDDCHAADEPSLRLLDFVAKQIRQTHVMLLITYRETDIRHRALAHDIVTGLAREGHRYSLQNLAEDDVRAFLAERAPGINEAGLAKRLFHTTEGNPFFLNEIVNLIAARHPGEKPDDWNNPSFEVPEQVGAAIRMRCRLVSESARQILDAAATIGVEFEVRLLAQVIETDVPAVAGALLEACNFELVRRDPRHSTRYKFVHALFAETLYGDLALETREQYHLRIARVLIADRCEPGEIASHLLKALPSGDFAEAVEYARRAGRRAIDALAYEDAAEFFQLALERLEDYRSNKSPEYCELMIELAEAKLRAGNFTTAIEKFEQAAQIARDLPEPLLLARAAFGMGSLVETPGVVNRRLIGQLETALDILGDADDGWRAMLLARLAEALQWWDPENRRVALAREAVTLARRVGNPATLGDVLYRTYVATINPDSAEERLATTTEILALTRQNPRLGLRVGYMRMRDLLELGRIEDLDREIRTYSELAAELRQRHLGYAEAASAMRAMMDGRFEEAERLALEALNLGQSRRDTMAAQAFATQISLIRREQGRFSEMEPIIKSFVVQFPELVFARCAIAFCYSELEQRDDALFHFDLLAQEGFVRLRRDATWLASMALLTETCVFLGDSVRGEILYRDLLPFARRQASLDIYVSYGPVALYLGMLATMLGKFDDAEKQFELALDESSRIGARPWHAHARYRYALMLHRCDDSSLHGKSRALLGAALGEARALNMKSLERKLCAVESTVPAKLDERTDLFDKPDRRIRVQNIVLCVGLSDARGLTTLGERGWRDLLHRFHTVANEQLSPWKGHKIEEGNDFMVATFDDAAGGIAAAHAIGEAVSHISAGIRTALFAGDHDPTREEALAIAATLREQVLSSARAGEVLVVSGSCNPLASDRIRFTDTGVIQLKDVAYECRLFKAEIIREQVGL